MENRGSRQNNRVILQGKREAFSAERYGRDAAGYGKNHRIPSNRPDGLFGRKGLYGAPGRPAFIGPRRRRRALPHHPKQRRALGGLRQNRPGHRRQHRPGARSGTRPRLFGGRGAAGRRAGGPAGTAPRTRPGALVPPAWPQTRADRQAGRVYLQGRGLSADTLDHAERTGFLRYARGGVLFVGRDGQGAARNVSQRLIAARSRRKTEARSGGQRPDRIRRSCRATRAWSGSWRAASMPWRRGTWRSGAARRRPRCWSAAGPRCAVSWTTRPCKPCCCTPIRWSWCGTTNARNSKQAETDAAHDRQIARIRELRGTCADWRPPVGVKDVAELNQREQGGRSPLGANPCPAGNGRGRVVMSASPHRMDRTDLEPGDRLHEGVAGLQARLRRTDGAPAPGDGRAGLRARLRR